MRVLHLTNPLMKGEDVSYVQKLLVGVKLMTAGQVDGEFGPGTGAACVKIKERLGYPTSACVPTAGDTLVSYLTGQKKLPVAYALRRKARLAKTGETKAELAEAKARAASLAWWDEAVKHNAPYHYGQVRPIEFLSRVWEWACTTDCSGSCTKGAKASDGGMPDPNGPQGGKEWSGLGYTGTMLSHCTHVTEAMAKPGDYAVFGSFPGHHVVTLVERLDNGDWKVASHGQESDPRYTLLSSEQSYQPSPTTFLSAF